MALYCGIDLHSTNCVIVLIDKTDRVQLEERVPNQLDSILELLEPYRDEVVAVAVESTFNWYWLVDGLEEAGFRVQLVDPCAIQPYEGKKFRDDRHDARWLAHHTGRLISGNSLKQLDVDTIDQLLPEPAQQLTAKSSLAVIDTLNEQIHRLECHVLERTRPNEHYRLLLTVPGIGQTLALVILYETGDIQRFPRAGNYASYCRCVPTQHLSNRKKKGEGNRRNGNRFLSWAFAEAAVFVVRFQPDARVYYERKRKQAHPMVAFRAVANKLAKATYYMLRDNVPYEPARLFPA